MPRPRNKHGNIPVVLCSCKVVYEYYVPGEYVYVVDPKTIKKKKQKKKTEKCPVCSSLPGVGKRFASKLECKVYQDLCQEHGASNVMRQVSLLLSNGERIIPDFMVIVRRVDYPFLDDTSKLKAVPMNELEPSLVLKEIGGKEYVASNRAALFGRERRAEVIFIDAKGKATHSWLRKAKQLKAEHGIEIQLRRK